MMKMKQSILGALPLVASCVEEKVEVEALIVYCYCHLLLLHIYILLAQISLDICNIVLMATF